MKILKITGIVILVLVVILVAWGAMLPSSTHLEREIVVDASQEALYEELTSYRGFNEWSPWFTIDPEGTTYTYEGPESGVGAKMTWTSEHPDVGSGAQEIIEAKENEMIKNKMDFGFQGDYYATFTLSVQDDGTKLIWAYDAENLGLMSKIFGQLFDAETMVGASYEKGLVALKDVMENRVVEEPEMEEESMESDSTMVETDSTVME